MKRRLHFVLLTATFFLFFNELTFGTNFGFLPGDACFHTTLDQKFIENLDKVKDPVFTYVRPKNASQTLCGYGGFFKLKHTDMPNGFKQNLKKVYQQIRDEYRLEVTIFPEKIWSNELQKDIPTGKIIKEEINPIHVFFVNAGFDIKRFKIGLKYNESWAEEMHKIVKHDLSQTQLDRFVDSGNAVMQDWRDAKLVRKLDTKCPELGFKNHNVPIEVSGKLKAIVLPTGDIKDYFRGKGFYIVDEDKIEVISGKLGGPGKEKGGLFNP